MWWFGSVGVLRFAGPWVALAIFVLLSPDPAPAANPAFKPKEAQFVFIIDDSGSMSDPEYGQNDPDRLAVFAVRALLGVLDERDWVSVVRLNGPSEGEESPLLAPLRPSHRNRMKQILDLGGNLAAYSGRNTPCRTALEQAFELLNAEHRPDVSQVVILLTDGSCAPPGEDRTVDLLENLASHQEERFQFYLLQFEGTTTSPDLKRMANATGGSAINLRGGDPTQILNTFAQALSRSQGYESQILKPTDNSLPSHQGARSVRLLAVAPGASPDLEISVTQRDGGRPVPVEKVDTATHHFQPDGREYRFTSARYRPTGEPVTVSVEGAGESWEMVALPEYRLSGDMEIYQGRCTENGAKATDVVGAGSDLCAVIRLINERGEVVGRDITAGQLQGLVELTSSDGVPAQIREDPDALDKASFRLDLPNLKEGVFTVRAEVILSPPGGSPRPPLPAGSRTIQAIDREIRPQPASLELGDTFPGSTFTEMVAIEGNFPDTEVRLVLDSSEELPSCISLRFAGRPMGDTVRIRRGQKYPLQLRVAEGCGQTGVFPVKTQIEVEMEKLPEVGVLTVPLSFRLDTTVREAPTLRFELAAGGAGEGIVNPPPHEMAMPTSPAAFRYDATIEPLDSQDLRLGFLNERGDVRMQLNESGEPVLQQQVAISPNEPLTLRVEALRCCDTGVYRGRLRLAPIDGGAPIMAQVEVSVTGDWWTCRRPLVLAILGGLLVSALAYYLVSMFTHVQWIPRKQLATRLVPLYWPAYGGKPVPGSDRGADREVVMEIVNAGMSWQQRALSWLKANPLIFGLPKQRYRETAELNLAPSLELSSVDLKGERDIVGRLQSSTEMDPSDDGRLFARAITGLHFFAVRGPRGRVGDLTPEGWYGKADGYTIEQLSKSERLIHKAAATERREGHIGGWELG